MLTIAFGELNRFQPGNEKKLCEASRQIKPTLHIAESLLDRHFTTVCGEFAPPPEFVLDRQPGD